MPRRRKSKALPSTLGELRASGYESRPIRDEIRANLSARIESGDELFPGILGYEKTTIPEIENALLSGQDMIILGERGQAKSRMVRAITGLFDERVPIIKGSEINDDPYAPISRAGIDIVAEQGDDTPIEWLAREDRYGEKLATPDITMSELLGDVDPIKVAEGRYLSDELTIHYGLIPRANRGIFCINELPDLAERIQVGLFNLMEERDIQIKGYRVRMPLDILIVATANPEDYTNRGRIITPLKDRYGAQVRTHYPERIEDELKIVEQERSRYVASEERVHVPPYMAEVIGEITSLARRSPEINQRSGVSVRMTIANIETARASALRRALRHGEGRSSVRVSDLSSLTASIRGKLELETIEEGRETDFIDELVKRSVLGVFDRHFRSEELDGVVVSFDPGTTVEAGQDLRSEEYVNAASRVVGLGPVLRRLEANDTPNEVASAVEFVLEGLHLNRRLNRDSADGRVTYREKPKPPSLREDIEFRVDDIGSGPGDGPDRPRRRRRRPRDSE
ncbi:MAG: sigma 54-interacting transcriptional regulator [Chloroflexi bacterium]|nr:sigma 54-interacting transcriptional regulator [Chloroflexota bacterium]